MDEGQKANFRMACLIEASKLKQTDEYNNIDVVSVAIDYYNFVIGEGIISSLEKNL